MASSFSVLLLEPDLDEGQRLADFLESAGCRVQWCKLAEQASYRIGGFDCVLLRQHLPDADGLALIGTWRRQRERAPVLLMTCSTRADEIVRGLYAGADDCICAPVNCDELLARMQSIQRRRPTRAIAGFNDLFVNLDVGRGEKGGERVEFTAMELAVLKCLENNRGRITTRDEFSLALKPLGLGESQSNSVEVIIHRLRKKLGRDFVKTHRRLGYRLTSEY